ncbi:hypothetical protein BBJ28_00013262 [Nothophytophthora sp. Chile5]|nr:hypothetical protein BBJ28_00013262 [Nothophytophthora sp. Chile5]
MDSSPSTGTARSSRPPRRAQRLLPALTPASAAQRPDPTVVVERRCPARDAKIERLNAPPQPTDESDGAVRSADPTRLLPGKKPSSIARFGAHIFFNRRPLDLIRRTTSTLLANTTGASASSNASVAAATPVSVSSTSSGSNPSEERKFWQPHRPTESSRRRLQHLPPKDKTSDHAVRSVRPKAERQVHRRTRHGDAGDANNSSNSGATEAVVPVPRRQSACPPTGAQFLLDVAASTDLTASERVEIRQYDEIRFVSTRAVKRRRRHGKIRNDMPIHGDDAVAIDTEEPKESPGELFNDGYDDERGDYLMLVGDHLAFRYEVLHALGHGSFGQVVCCLDHRTQRQVAVKIIRNRRKYRDQALVEVQLLSQLQQAAASCPEKPRVVHMEEYFFFRDHVCIAFEVLGTNLYDLLKLRYFRGLPMHSVQTVGMQLARALAFLKHQQVVHCDLKPENVLLGASTLLENARSHGIVDDVTLIDLGSSCLEGATVFTYIQSRFYRSPEVLLGQTYAGAIDMWSLACILVELHTGHPIFAGENEREQLACIMEVLGVPPTPLLRKSKRCTHFFDEVASPAEDQSVEFVAKPFVNSRGRRRTPGSRTLAAAVKSEDPEFLEFLAKCFVWDPRERLAPEQAMQEPWLRRLQQDQGVRAVEYAL